MDIADTEGLVIIAVQRSIIRAGEKSNSATRNLRSYQESTTEKPNGLSALIFQESTTALRDLPEYTANNYLE